ncbi:hypothetical protein HDU91_006513, partial [Kappamyces sp. JEL0680]
VNVGGNWLEAFSLDFKKRFIELLGYQFKLFSPSLVLSVLDSPNTDCPIEPVSTAAQVAHYFSPFDLKRLESYSQNLLDYHVILDMLHTLSRLYFLNAFCTQDERLRLSAVQGAIFIAVGLQKKTVEEVEADLGVSVSQILALFAKAVRKCSLFLDGLVKKSVEDQVSEQVSTAKKNHPDLARVGARDMEDDSQWQAAAQTLDEDLEEGGNEALQAFRDKQREMIDSLDLSSYTVGGNDDDWKNVKLGGSNVVAVANAKSSKKRKAEESKGTADELVSKHLGISTGIHDPKGVIAKMKAKAKAKKKNKK